MTRARSIKILLCGSILAACGGGEALVVPLFVFGFSGATGGVQVGVFFDPDTPTTSSGTFNFVNLNVDGNVTQYGGTWSNCTFALSLPQGQSATAPAADSYSGRFQGMDTVVLTPPSGSGRPTLTLQRQGTPPQRFDC